MICDEHETIERFFTTGVLGPVNVGNEVVELEVTALSERIMREVSVDRAGEAIIG